MVMSMKNFAVLMTGVCVCLTTMASIAHASASIPTSAWLVGPASMSSAGAGSEVGAGAGIPCIVTNQFNNGYGFRFSGGGGRLLAVAIDFGQAQFTKGHDYDVEIDIPGTMFQIVPARAHDEKTLLLGFKTFPDIYPALKNAKTMNLKVGENAGAAFTLVGLGEGFARMEACYKGDNSPLANAARTTQGEQMPPGVFEIKSNSGDAIILPKASAPSRDVPAPALPQPTMGGNQNAQNGGGLTPMPGEETVTADARIDANTIETLLNRAADDNARAYVEAAGILAKAKAGENKGRALAERGIEPVRTTAPTPPAASIPLDRTATAKPKEVSTGHELAKNWSDPTVKRANVGDIIRGETATRTAGGTNAAAESAMATGHRWAAVKGNDLKAVVETWGAQQGLSVIWMADRSYTIQRSVNFQGPMNGALLRLLEQFDSEAQRPIGRIYNDPTAMGQVLVIETDRSWRP